GPLAVGQAFNKDVKLSIAVGATAFAAGDSFVVRVGVEGGDLQYAALNPAANDGTQKASAVAIHGATTGGTMTIQIAAITNDAELIGPVLSWPAGITAAQKDEAILQLRKAGIKVR
ncbi:MAG: head decoration protein, partial [Bradyrhizobium sp.]